MSIIACSVQLIPRVSYPLLDGFMNHQALYGHVLLLQLVPGFQDVSGIHGSIRINTLKFQNIISDHVPIVDGPNL